MRKTAPLLASLLLLGCIERPGDRRPEAPGIDKTALGDVFLTTPPEPKVKSGASFNDDIELVGFDFAPSPMKRGEKATITVYYQAKEDIRDDWQIFVHVEDETSDGMRVNRDHAPGRGQARTSTWRRGDYVKDQYDFVVPDDASKLSIYTGFFSGNDRMPIATPGRTGTDGSNRLRLGPFAVE